MSNVLFTAGEPTYNWQALYQAALDLGTFDITDNSPQAVLTLTVGTTQLVIEGVGLQANGARSLTAGAITGFILRSGAQEIVRIDAYANPPDFSTLQTILTEYDQPVPNFAAIGAATAALLLLEPLNVTGSNDREVFGSSLVGGDTGNLNGGNDVYVLDMPAAAVTMDGGAGRDFLQIGNQNRTNGVHINFESGEVRDSDTQNLLANVAGFEDTRGSQYDDRINTSSDEAGDYFFEASQGNDHYEGWGGDGYVRLSYRYLFDLTGVAGGVNVNAATGRVIKAGSLGIDTFWGIDTIQGTNYADTFYGTVWRDEFEGLDGADSFNGSGGEDRVNYSAEIGTRGVFVNLSDTSNVGAISGVSGNVTVAAHTALDSYGKTDTLISIEEIIGTDVIDRLIGDNKNNAFWGHAGSDKIYGNGGDDELNGGAGNDSLYGGSGRDDIRGGVGNDTIDGGDGDDHLNGGEGSDTINAGDGAFDNISGSGGTDTLNGSDGFDMYTFDQFDRQEDANGDGNPANQNEHAGDAITVTLTGGVGAGTLTGYFGLASTKPTPTRLTVSTTFSNLERIRGSEGNDSFTMGTGFSNTEDASDSFTDALRTGPGVFELIGGKGNDTFIDSAGTGLMMVNYRDEAWSHPEFNDDNDYRWGDGGEPGVAVNLTQSTKTIVGFGAIGAGKAKDTWLNTDTITGVQAFRLTDARDVLIAGDAAVSVRGEDGDDEFTGGLGADQFQGGQGNDTANGGSGNDRLNGEEGDDTLRGSYGNDQLNGGDGNDNINGDSGNDSISGDAGDDTLNGAAGRDNVGGGSGNDIILGGAGNDNLNGDNGDDDISGEDGHDEVSGGDGNDTVRGDAGDDRVRGGRGLDTLIGGLGQDNIEGDDDDDTIYGDDLASLDALGGIDRINGGQGNDLIFGGYGDDQLEGGNGQDTIRGGAGDDWVNGGADDDMLYGDDDEDEIFGNTGNDTIEGGNGDDAINGGEGDDIILGGEGHDDLYGGDGDGADVIDGGNGDDRVYGGEGADSLSGGGGSDDLYGGDGNYDDTLDGGAGADMLGGGEGNDTYVLGAEASGVDHIWEVSGTDLITTTINRSLMAWGAIENLTLLGTATEGQGNQLDNVLTGNQSNNVLGGDIGNDTLLGLGGADTLLGDAGNDFIVGGLNRDVMTGGDGDDTFDFDLVTEAGNNGAVRDVVTDFSQVVGNRDIIDLSGIDAVSSVGGDQAFSFVVAKGGAFAGAGSLIWSQANFAGTANDKTLILGDVTGDGVSDFQIELTGLINLTAADFLL